jgi:glyoxylase-like metal-dependent hydrolase (beta-lactamase superfamily II)
MKRVLLLIGLTVVGELAASAANVEAQSVLSAAAKAMGVSNMKSIQYSGTGWKGAVGQNYTPAQDWPRSRVSSYTRTLDFDSKSSKEDLVLTQYTDEMHGANWYIPNVIDGEQRQTLMVSGNYAWNIDRDRVVPQPALAETRQLEIWLTPYGFLKAAMESNDATVVSRSEYNEKVKVVSFKALGKYRVNGTIDENNLVIRVQTWLPNPVVGDMYYETIYSNYKDIGGVKFPARWHQHNDHDDNNGLPNPSGGDHSIGLETISDVKVNVNLPSLAVPDEVRKATIPPTRVEAQKLADGVWYLGGGSHNSLAIEFRDYVAVVEAPLNEERSLAVIDEVYKLVPQKPIRYLINTHHHWDHIGGLRTYVHEGATVITHEGNKRYYQEILQEKQWLLKPDRLSLYPPEELAEGYTIDTVNQKYILSDGVRSVELHTVQGLAHAGGMLLVYLPKEKIVVEADMYTPPASGTPQLTKPNASNVVFSKNVQRLKLDVSTIVPIHGRVAQMDEFVKFVGQAN